MLKKYKCDTGKIQFNTCKTAKNQKGRRFLRRVAKISGMYAIGYMDTYAVEPHGLEIMVSPSGSEKVNKVNKAYKGNSQTFWELMNYEIKF